SVHPSSSNVTRASVRGWSGETGDHEVRPDTTMRRVRFPLFTFAAGAFALLLLALSGPLYRLGVPLAAALTLMRWAAYAGAVAVSLSLVALVMSYWRRRRGAAAIALFGLAMAGTAVGVPYYWLRAD